MSAGTSAPAPKEKKFGVKVCRERNCPELKGDPKYPESPQRCELIGGMPGVMSCCIKEADDDEFIRRIHGLNLSPSNAQRPGVRNCPKTCPYKIFIDGEKFVWEKGKAQGKKIPAKIGTCAFTGKAFDEWSTCPCNVLGNPRQEDQIKRLQIIVSARLRNTNPTIGLCNMGICPDGKNRGGPSTEDDLCPVIRLPYDEINIGRGCPLWRIPAKMLPATIAQDPVIPAKSAHADKKSGHKEKKPSRKPAQKEKPEEEAIILRDARRSGRWFICRVCENEEIGQNICKLETLIPPVGCTAVSQEGDQQPDAPMANWVPFTGKAEPHRETKKKSAPGNASLFDFDPEALVPCSGNEIPGICDECDGKDNCPNHDPKAGCRDVVTAIEEAMETKDQPATTKNPICYCTPSARTGLHARQNPRARNARLTGKPQDLPDHLCSTAAGPAVITRGGRHSTRPVPDSANFCLRVVKNPQRSSWKRRPGTLAGTGSGNRKRNIRKINVVAEGDPRSRGVRKPADKSKSWTKESRAETLIRDDVKKPARNSGRCRHVRTIPRRRKARARSRKPRRKHHDQD